MSKKLTIREACSAFVDCVNRTAPITEGGGHYAIGTPAMRGNKISLSEVREIDVATFNKWTRRLVPKEDDILIAREAPVGPVVRIPSGDVWAAGQRTTHLRANPEIINPRYLYYLLISPEIQTRLQFLAMGSTVPHIRVADLENFVLPELPPLKIQDSIASVLGALDDKIAANDRIEALTLDLLSASYTEAGFDRSDRPLAPVTDFIEVSPKIPTSKGSGKFLEMKNLPESKMTVSTWSIKDSTSGSRFQNGDTLLARITPCLQNGKAAFVDFLKDQEVGYGSTEYIVMRPRPEMPAALPYLISKSERFRDFAIKHMIGTSGRQRLNSRDVEKYLVGIPDKDSVRNLSALCNALLPRIKSAVAESRVLSSARDELLPLLMSGKITVKDAEATVSDLV